VSPSGVVAALVVAGLMMLAMVVLSVVWKRSERAEEERDRRR
jgi:hypothetical protein